MLATLIKPVQKITCALQLFYSDMASVLSVITFPYRFVFGTGRSSERERMRKLDILRKASTNKFVDIWSDVHSFSNYGNIDIPWEQLSSSKGVMYCTYVSRVKEEFNRFNGAVAVMHRVYAHERDLGDYAQVGWVLSGDVERCMICSTNFSMKRFRHHCRACGNLVCDTCCPEEVVIEAIKFAGPQRVCAQCHCGQVRSALFFVKCVLYDYSAPYRQLTPYITIFIVCYDLLSAFIIYSRQRNQYFPITS